MEPSISHGGFNRSSAGITNGRVFRNAQDPNDVVILQDVVDVAKARAWLGSDDLKTEMQKNVSASRPRLKPSPAVRKARR
jgi:hypothetical protein